MAFAMPVFRICGTCFGDFHCMYNPVAIASSDLELCLLCGSCLLWWSILSRRGIWSMGNDYILWMGANDYAFTFSLCYMVLCRCIVQIYDQWRYLSDTVVPKTGVTQNTFQCFPNSNAKIH
jgi:hypothetical protein